MNILFMEDDPDLQASGVLQLETKGHQVFPTYDLEESREIMADESLQIDLVISDHRLPDGLGIQFVIELQKHFPKCKSAIVSGCLNADDIEQLEKHKIPYYKKPLLYTKVIEEMRRRPALDAPIYTPPPAEPEPQTELEVAPVEEAPRKKLFGFLKPKD